MWLSSYRDMWRALVSVICLSGLAHAQQGPWTTAVQREKRGGWIILSNSSGKAIRITPTPLMVSIQYQYHKNGMGGGGSGTLPVDSIWIGKTKLNPSTGIATIPKGGSIRYKFLPFLRSSPNAPGKRFDFDVFVPGKDRVVAFLKFEPGNHPGAWQGQVQVDLMTDLTKWIYVPPPSPYRPLNGIQPPRAKRKPARP